jgi:hypothetical protein
MKYIYIIIFILGLSVESLAGGYHIQVKVIDLILSKTEEDTFTVVFEIIDHRLENNNNCSKFTVTGGYDKNAWRNYKRPMSIQSHRNSLTMLKKANKNKRTILFGEMGNGLKPVGNCKYISKGLFHEKYENRNAIYSVHDPI